MHSATDLVAKDSNEYSPNSPTLRRSQSHHAASATKRAASWARDPNLFKVLQRLLSSSPSDDPNAPSEDLIQELKMNLDMKASSPIAEEDLITSPKKLSALSTLHESLVSGRLKLPY